MIINTWNPCTFQKCKFSKTTLYSRTHPEIPLRQCICKEWSVHRRQSEWLVHRRESEWLVHLYFATVSKFANNERSNSGNAYQSNTFSCGPQRYIKEHRLGLNIFFDPQLSGFCKTLDSEMKRLRSTGVGGTRKQVELLTVEEEHSMLEGSCTIQWSIMKILLVV